MKQEIAFCFVARGMITGASPVMRLFAPGTDFAQATDIVEDFSVRSRIVSRPAKMSLYLPDKTGGEAVPAHDPLELQRWKGLPLAGLRPDLPHDGGGKQEAESALPAGLGFRRALH
ncbi:MAG TPA: hypothetical protein VHX61_18410 [Rhizomicrobium sp.]|nr:hypothetical protein [Rhizomicrobium sp.]